MGYEAATSSSSRWTTLAKRCLCSEGPLTVESLRTEWTRAHGNTFVVHIVNALDSSLRTRLRIGTLPTAQWVIPLVARVCTNTSPASAQVQHAHDPMHAHDTPASPNRQLRRPPGPVVVVVGVDSMTPTML